MSKKVELYLEDSLFDLLSSKAEARDITVLQYIPEVLSQHFAKELSVSEMSDFTEQLKTLKEAVLRYAIFLDEGKEFVLRNVPEYRDNTVISDSMRIRLARSINEAIKNDCSLSSVIERVFRNNGTPKLRGGAAVYKRKENSHE